MVFFCSAALWAQVISIPELSISMLFLLLMDVPVLVFCAASETR